MVRVEPEYDDSFRALVNALAQDAGEAGEPNAASHPVTAELTARQREVLEVFVRYERQERIPPTVRWLGAALGIRSTNGVFDHLQALTRKGFLACRPARTWAHWVSTAKGRVAVSGGLVWYVLDNQEEHSDHQVVFIQTDASLEIVQDVVSAIEHKIVLSASDVAWYEGTWLRLEELVSPGGCIEREPGGTRVDFKVPAHPALLCIAPGHFDRCRVRVSRRALGWLLPRWQALRAADSTKPAADEVEVALQAYYDRGGEAT